MAPMFAPMSRAIVAVALLGSFVAANPSQSAPTPIPTPSLPLPKMNALTNIGCFDDPTPLLDYGPWTFQSSGNCQPICYELGLPVMATSGGTNCWCGEYLPPVKAAVANDTCSTTCSGFNKEFCKLPICCLLI